MAFGIIVGPVTNLIEKELFVELAPLMSVIALSVILFEAGITVNLELLLEGLSKAILVSVTSIMTSIIVLGLLLNYVMPNEFTLLGAMLLGSMVGGTSTVSVFGILSGIEREVKDLTSTKILLTMESIVSDPFCIIASITIIKMILTPNVEILDAARTIVIIFVASSLLGLFIGLIWSRILDRLRHNPFTYMLTIGVLLPAYIISEEWIGEGGGAMTALTFGLAITNYRFIMNQMGWKSRVKIDSRRLREFHEEIAFFIKSFFFVYIGLVVSLSLKYTFYGFGITLVLMFIRIFVIEVLSRVISFTTSEKALSQFIYASGLPAFVMSQLPQIFDPNSEHFASISIYTDLCMPIVVGTVIYSSIVGPFGFKQRMAAETRKKEKELAENSETDSEDAQI
jgi:cell volume regulation protein A